MLNFDGMTIKKAVITRAAPHQRTLPLQTLVDRDGKPKSVLGILLGEVRSAGIDDVAVVIRPGDETSYAAVAGADAGRVRFVHQAEPRGYGDALLCARPFVGEEPFLHLVGDHLSVSTSASSSARRIVELAVAEQCAVSAVQATREHLLTQFGTVGGNRVPGHEDRVRVECVVEKPTPTYAEQHLTIPGMRTGSYLCFFGMHVLTPSVLAMLQKLHLDSGASRRVTLSDALDAIARREQYLALEVRDLRYDLGMPYGLLQAQLAIGLSGVDRDEILTRLIELLALRTMGEPRPS
jgi:UTP--glucose-1-phosphate uridylyltransferase